MLSAIRVIPVLFLVRESMLLREHSFLWDICHVQERTYNILELGQLTVIGNKLRLDNRHIREDRHKINFKSERKEKRSTTELN